MKFPKLYVILDVETLERRGLRLSCVAGELARAGVELVQLRDKQGSPQDVLRRAAEVEREFAGTQCRLVMNDRADLAVLAGWTGVHVGHKDMPPVAVREVLSGAFVGVSTHDGEQVRAADAGEADYVAIGPVFATSTKLDAEPVVGLDGVRKARALTSKPLVAIGGITLENARSVIDAGADSVAVISALFVPGERPGKVAEELIARLSS
ncbi:thiamine phosphate synthase [Granulicella cerasi]|uniref:Thiamine-phosphate synthase n=1 Tax=Granulicella cerasi TaxID=741063 RepID=A0ABW1Z4E3_9BACT|nr:thiamine phosphate synthase [Granulicella cerasi]